MLYGQEFAEAIDYRHGLHGYVTDFWALTSSMNIAVQEGTYNSAVFLPRPVITLEPEVYYSDWSFTRFHELAHTVLRDSGIGWQLAQEADYPEQYRAWIEAYCNFGAAQFQMPNPMLRRVLSQYGYSPQAVLALTRVAGVDLFDAMYRVTHGFLESDARRTAFLTQGSYLRKAVTTNAWFPHSEGDRIPEVALTLSGAKLLTLPLRFGRNRVLGLLND
ncbi:ImmA/IrrE family metallo-endopeptidase [Deinococcus hopiensis]|uniref:IrrE N-terminal-like domain-containing protein n=1 Tax=Deinococcus hopiensis KR-140 TaxID=695939 RepID=A0A1W1UYX6_9DEIO|nr:hypothetical protein [Deinococcus hopiensis]SMB85914.1 protein of unknown function [Deinococcus hopiensis KR-140]